MNKVWKIILIVLGALLLLALCATPLLLRFFIVGGPMMRYGGIFGGHHMGGFGGFGMIGGGLMMLGSLLFTLAVIGLVVYGIIALVRNLSHQTPQTPPPAPAASTVVESAPVEPAAAVPTCAHCGKPLQADWAVCPYCGEKI